MKAILILLCITGTIAGNLRPSDRDIEEKISTRVSTFNQEHLDALQNEIKVLEEKDDYAAAAELTDTYWSRKLIRDADRHNTCFQDSGRYVAEADYLRNPFKANNDRGDWGKCLPEELFGIMCEHELPHMLNDNSWKLGDGPQHDEPSEQLFWKVKSLHDKQCVHVDLDISDEVQEQFNDFLHARNKYAHNKITGDGDITDVVLKVEADQGKYFLNGVQNPVLTMVAGVTYTFLTDSSSMKGHPFKIGENIIGEKDPVDVQGVTGNSSITTVQLPLDVNVTSDLVYYCKAHSNMGNAINVVAAPRTTYVVIATEGKYYLNGQKNPEIALTRGETYKFVVSSMVGHPFRIGVRHPINNLSGETSKSNNLDGVFDKAVVLSAKGYQVEYDIGKEQFNERFRECPVVQYTRNTRVHSVYLRTSAIPMDFDAYNYFTYMWSNTNNTLNVDFEMFDDIDDLLEGKDKWMFCNYNDRDVGYPRDCGKKGKVDRRWFSMPFDRAEAPGLHAGASFHIHSAAGCPSLLGPDQPYEEGVTITTNEVTFTVPMDAPSKLTYYCGEHPGMGNNIIVPVTTRGRNLEEYDIDVVDSSVITYDMACVQKYPNNPRFAMQMSLYCMTAFFSHGDVSADLFDSPYSISSSCDIMMRSHKRTLALTPANAPSAFCEQDVEKDTCTVRAFVYPFPGRTCRSYCESFPGLTCASANVAQGGNEGGKCLAGREMSCDAEQDRVNNMLCTCTTDKTNPNTSGNAEAPLTTSTAQLLSQFHQQVHLCSENFVKNTATVYTKQSQTCNKFCLSAGLACFTGKYAEANSCIERHEHRGHGCSISRSDQLCTCGPIGYDGSQVVEAVDNVNEASQYTLQYKLDIPNKPTFTSNVPYTSVPGPVSEFTRIAYYMQLIDYQGISQWVWVSMDAFTDDISKIGVPNVKSAAVFQQEIYNLTVASSIASLNGYDGTGNIEFWPNDYGPNNKKEVPGASSSKFDWGDERSSSGSYGSMQVHATNLKSTIFAFNRWNRNEAADIGIGNRKYDHPDWTFASNAEDYVFKRIEVFVKNPSAPTEAPTTSPTSAQTRTPTEAPTETLTAVPTSTQTNAPTKEPDQESDCADATEDVCDPNSKKKKCKECRKWKKKKCGNEWVALSCPLMCGTCNANTRRRLETGFSNELVSLTGTDITVKFNEGEDKFNEMFAACPIVQYTRNNEVYAVYRRMSIIPAGYNAYKAFTETWEGLNNWLNRDFELYDSMADLINQEGNWTYCDYGSDTGFPRNCGKSGQVRDKWFAMPDKKKAPYLTKGASLAVHNVEGCPLEAPIDPPSDCTGTQFIGCYKDTGNRALPNRRGSGNNMAQCLANCMGFEYAARQHHGECWCGNGDGYKKYGIATDCTCGARHVGGWRNCVHKYDNCGTKYGYKLIDGVEDTGAFTDLVGLTGTDIAVKVDVGEKQFNDAFALCPAVQYTRNKEVTAVYMRRTPIPDGFNAYRLFTDTWEDTNNVLSHDYEIYDNLVNLTNGEDKWTYCNYNNRGFPGNCGKTGYTSSRWFSMPDKDNAPYLKQGASLAVHSAEGCPIDELVSRNNATDINNYACKRMALHPHNGIKSYYGSDRIVQWPESCTVEAKVEIGGSCDGFCSSFKSMFCVGAHGDTNAFFDDGLSVECDANHSKEFAACQCATNMTAKIEEDEHASKPTSNACINLAFGGDFTKHQIYEYCDSEPSTCTVNINAKATGATCSEFCTSHEDMVCLSASEANRYERLQCASGKKIECDDSSGQDYIQCECGIVMGSERVETLKRGPVLRENTQDYCPAYTTVGNNDHANERSRRYQKVTLTLGVNDDESDGSIPVVAAKMVPDLNNNNLDSYNTQDVEVCDGLEYTKKNDDPPESCSFGHRFDSKSNCYGKLEMNFENASQKCAARGGHLLRLDDEEELDKLNMVFRRQRFSIGMHSDGTSHGMEWDGYPGCKVDIEKDLSFLKVNTRWDINHDCWELNLDTKQMYPHSCTDTRTWICEGKRPSEKRSHRKECTSDSVLVGDGGDLKRDEGGFCLFYLEDPKLTLPDDESGGFRNTELAHFLSFSPETRTRKYYLEYGHLVDAEFRGYYENDHNWDDLILSSIGINSTDPIMDIDHETDDFHCHFSPTNFGISRIYLQQHMLERIYPGAFKKHCFCGYKHLGKLVSRCDCTKNGVRNNNCQKEHRPMLYEATYKENGEYVYCNNGQCDQASP